MIPVPTTLVDVRRANAPAGQDPYAEGYDDGFDDTDARVVRGLRAAITVAGAGIGNSGGQALATGGQQQVVRHRFVSDPADIGYRDEVVDADGLRYEVLWVVAVPDPFGLAHMRGELRRIEGQS